MATIRHAIEKAFRSGGAAVIDELGGGISHGTSYGPNMFHGYYVRSGLEHNDGNRVTGYQRLEDEAGCWIYRDDLPAVFKALHTHA